MTSTLVKREEPLAHEEMQPIVTRNPDESIQLANLNQNRPLGQKIVASLEEIRVLVKKVRK